MHMCYVHSLHLPPKWLGTVHRHQEACKVSLYTVGCHSVNKLDVFWSQHEARFYTVCVQQAEERCADLVSM